MAGREKRGDREREGRVTGREKGERREGGREREGRVTGREEGR